MSNTLEKLLYNYMQVLERQSFDEEALDYSIFEAHKRQLDALSLLQESSISVFDMCQRRHIYLSQSFERVLGYDIEEAHQDGNSYFDSKVHPEDLMKSLISGTHFLEMAFTMSAEEKMQYKMIQEYRIRHAQGHYVRVIEQFKGFELDAAGNLWLSLCVLDISPDQDENAGFKARLLNTRTGQMYEAPAPEPNEGGALSGREKEVLQLLAKGQISKQIADKLYISVHTVNTHRQRIIEKLHVSNTAEAINYASMLGLIA